MHAASDLENNWEKLEITGMRGGKIFAILSILSSVSCAKRFDGFSQSKALGITSWDRRSDCDISFIVFGIRLPGNDAVFPRPAIVCLRYLMGEK